MKNCNNCSLQIKESDNYCNHCGAKIIKSRITVKSLFSNFLAPLGWDSSFLITLRHLLYKPQIVLEKYINGTRKKYTDPFAFYAIMLTLSLFLSNNFKVKSTGLSTNIAQPTTELSTSNEKVEDTFNTEELDLETNKAIKEVLEPVLKKYYNIVSFLLLPIFTLIGLIVFGKPYNFGEHLVITTYIQSVVLFLSIPLSIVQNIFATNYTLIGNFVIIFLWYSFTYKKLYKLTFKQALLKFLKFTGILLLTIIFFLTAAYIIGTIMGYLSSI